MVQTDQTIKWLLDGFRYELGSTLDPQTVDYYGGHVRRFVKWMEITGLSKEAYLITKQHILSFFYHLLQETEIAIGSKGAWRNWFLWSAAKAFTLCDRPPVLKEDTWYANYARYLIDNQKDGAWVNPDWPEGESNLIATACGLLVLEKAVLPPPPGIDFVEIDHMRIEFDTRPDRDRIKILQARFQLADGASYDLAVDDVTVNVDGVAITIPAGSFKRADGEKYHYRSAKMAADDGTTYRVSMDLNFDTGEWSFMVHDIDASVVDSSDGVDVTLMIGYMLAGQNVPMWISYLVYPPQP